MFMKVPMYLFLLFSLCLQAITPLDEQDILKRCNILVNLPDTWVSELAHLGLSSEFDLCTGDQHADLPLFIMFPTLRETLAYIKLGDLPTPVNHLDNLGALLNLSHLYIKRDDCTGGFENGLPLYGGNKERKLEFLLADALAHKASCVMTFGATGSNHALATSFHAKRCGLKSICMLKEQVNSPAVQHNLLLQKAVGAELHHFDTHYMRKLATVGVWLEEYYKTGKFPYVIPSGGSCPIGAVGFVNAALELKDQINKNLLPSPDIIYAVAGSYGTVAGLMLGCKVAGMNAQIRAVAIEPHDPEEVRNSIKNLFIATNKLLCERDLNFPSFEFPEDMLVLLSDFTGPRYGVFTQEGNAASRIMLETEHIKLDGTYTAKAMAALIHESEQFADKTILFWDTYCGLDFSAYTKSVSPETLSYRLQKFFSEDNQ